MEFVELDSAPNREELIEYLGTIEWKAGHMLQAELEAGTYRARFGQSSELWFAYDGASDGDKALVGFGGIVEQDYNPVPEFDLWIASIYVAPDYRGRHLSQEILAFLEGRVRERGAAEVHIYTQHKGLYEKSGYQLVRDDIDIMGRDTHIYVKRF